MPMPSLDREQDEDSSSRPPKRHHLLPTPTNVPFSLFSFPHEVLTRIVTFLPRHTHIPFVFHFPVIRNAVLEQSRSVLRELDLFPTAEFNDYPPKVSRSLINNVLLTMRIAKTDLRVLRLHAGFETRTTNTTLGVARGCCPHLQTLSFADGGGVDKHVFWSVLACFRELQELVVDDPGIELVKKLRHIPSSCISLSLVATHPGHLEEILSSVRALSATRHADLSLKLEIGGNSNSPADVNAVKSFTLLLRREQKALDCLNHIDIRMSHDMYVPALQDSVLEWREERHDGIRWMPPEMLLTIEVEYRYRFSFPKAADDDRRTSDYKGCSKMNLYELINDMQALDKIETEIFPSILEIIVSPVEDWGHENCTDDEMDLLMEALQKHATGLRTVSVCRGFAVQTSTSYSMSLSSHESMNGLDKRYRQVVRIITRFLTHFPHIVNLSFPRVIFDWIESPAIIGMISAGRHLRVIHLRTYEFSSVTDGDMNLSIQLSRRDSLKDLTQFLDLVAMHCQLLTCVYVEAVSFARPNSSPWTRSNAPLAIEALDKFEQRLLGVDISTLRSLIEACR